MNVDKTKVRQSFARAARNYDAAAVLQREVGDRMLDRLDYIQFVPETILDVGAGTGYCASLLQRKFPRAQVYGLDIALPMLQLARQKTSWWARLRHKLNYVCADAEVLPLADDSVDMVYSNLTLQWCNQPETVLREFARVLRPGGMLLFSTFGPGTLGELRQAWQSVDEYTHVNAFIDLHDLGDVLMRIPFAEPVMDAERLTLTYADIYGLMRDLKAIGAHNITQQRPRGLSGRNKFKQLEQAYEAFRKTGVLPASYEVVYGHAWAPTVSSGSASIELSSLARPRRME